MGDMDISYNWHRVTTDHPRIGEAVLVWDPACGVRRAYRGSDGFFEALQGVTVYLVDGELVTEIVWWMPLPGRPAGEVEPENYVGAKRGAPQIGFADAPITPDPRVPKGHLLMTVNNSEAGTDFVLKRFFEAGELSARSRACLSPEQQSQADTLLSHLED